jgi:signal transduction histidine kinase
MARFNRMAESFARRQAKLTEAQSHLQETIAARTAELRAANERLNAIDQNRRRFFTDISHELRTPLTVIRGEAEMTLRHAGAVMPDTTRRSLETIANRAIRLNRRVDDMLRVARSETGRIELVLDDVDLGQIFMAAIDDVLPLAGQKNIKITAPEGGPVLCSGDKDWLRQILGGVLANSIKYSERDTAIVTACWQREGEVIAEISDEGSGLDDAELASVFERFERGSSSLSTGQPGHGVGLALAKWVIAEHGGSIRLESPGRLHKNNGAKRRGLTVLVSLMAAKAPDQGQRPCEF